MILDGNTHGDGATLASYMQTGKDGEIATVVQFRADPELFGNDPVQAFALMQGMAEASTKSTMPFFHGYIQGAPGERLTEKQLLETVDRMEKRLGFAGQPRFVTTHTDIETGQQNYHVGWFRMDVQNECIINPGLYPFRLMDEARKIEKDFGLRIVSSERQPGDRARPADRNEFDESHRLGTNIKDIRNGILDCFERSDNGKSFTAAIEARGWQLAQGDRANFVVIDQAGGHHALNKKLTGKTLADIRDRLTDLDRAQLPSVDQAKEMQAERAAARTAQERVKQERAADAPENDPTRSHGRQSSPQPEIKPLGKTAGEIRTAWRLTATAGQFIEEIERRGLKLVHVSREEAEASHRVHEFAKAVNQRAPDTSGRQTAPGTEQERAADEMLSRTARRPERKPKAVIQHRELKEGFAVVDRRGNVTRIDQRVTGDQWEEIQKRLGRIDTAALMSVGDAKAAQSEANRAEWKAQKEAERAKARIDAPVSGIHAEIREAWTQSRTASDDPSGDAERLQDALAARNIKLARATPDEARASQEQAALYPEQLRQYQEAQAAAASGRYAELKPATEIRRPHYSPALDAGEIVAIDRQGHVYTFDERTTGQLRNEIEARLAGIHADDLLSVAGTTDIMRNVARAEWIEQWRDEQDKARPATAVEQRIIDCRQMAREDGAQIVDRKGELKTVYGAEAFAARLDDAGLAIVRITETDARALDELRADENLARTAAWTNGESYRTHHFDRLEAGDIAAVNRAGDVYRLNPHRLDVDGIASALESAARDGRLPSMTEARIAFLIERNADAALRAENRAEFFGRHMEGMEIAAGYTELRTDVRNAEKAVSQGFDHAADQLGHVAHAASAFLSSVADKAASMIGGAAESLFPTAPPTPEQAERMDAAQQEFRRDLATWAAEEAEKAERDQARREIREAADKQRTYDKLTGRNHEDRQAEEDRERDRGRERDRW